MCLYVHICCYSNDSYRQGIFTVDYVLHKDYVRSLFGMTLAQFKETACAIIVLLQTTVLSFHAVVTDVRHQDMVLSFGAWSCTKWEKKANEFCLVKTWWKIWFELPVWAESQMNWSVFLFLFFPDNPTNSKLNTVPVFKWWWLSNIRRYSVTVCIDFSRWVLLWWRSLEQIHKLTLCSFHEHTTARFKSVQWSWQLVLVGVIQCRLPDTCQRFI